MFTRYFSHSLILNPELSLSLYMTQLNIFDTFNFIMVKNNELPGERTFHH